MVADALDGVFPMDRIDKRQYPFFQVHVLEVAFFLVFTVIFPDFNMNKETQFIRSLETFPRRHLGMEPHEIEAKDLCHPDVFFEIFTFRKTKQVGMVVRFPAPDKAPDIKWFIIQINPPVRDMEFAHPEFLFNFNLLIMYLKLEAQRIEKRVVRRPRSNVFNGDCKSHKTVQLRYFSRLYADPAGRHRPCAVSQPCWR